MVDLNVLNCLQLFKEREKIHTVRPVGLKNRTSFSTRPRLEKAVLNGFPGNLFPCILAQFALAKVAEKSDLASAGVGESPHLEEAILHGLFSSGRGHSSWPFFLSFPPIFNDSHRSKLS
jgi:hypothetical protein